MIKDGWGKEWPVVLLDAQKMYSHNSKAEIEFGEFKDKTPWIGPLSNDSTITDLKEEIKSLDVVDLVWIDFGSEPSKSFIGNRELKPQGSNLVDDEAYLYFQCSSCNNIFDPHTKSFAQLNQRRADAGWKVKWNVDGMGYKVYCPRCGDGK